MIASRDGGRALPLPKKRAGQTFGLARSSHAFTAQVNHVNDDSPAGVAKCPDQYGAFAVNAAASGLNCIDLYSRNSSSPYAPISRPRPDCL